MQVPSAHPPVNLLLGTHLISSCNSGEHDPAQASEGVVTPIMQLLMHQFPHLTASLRRNIWKFPVLRTTLNSTRQFRFYGAMVMNLHEVSRYGTRHFWGNRGQITPTFSLQM